MINPVLPLKPHLIGSFVIVETNGRGRKQEIDEIEERLMHLVGEVYGDFCEDPSWIQGFVDKHQAAAIEKHPHLAPAFLGKAIEKEVSYRVQDDDFLRTRLVYQPQQSATLGRPDFAHKEYPDHIAWDITTNEAIVAHLKRGGYGHTIRVIAYGRSPELVQSFSQALILNGIVLEENKQVTFDKAMASREVTQRELTIAQLPRPPPRPIHIVETDYEVSQARVIRLERQRNRTRDKSLRDELKIHITDAESRRADLSIELAHARVIERERRDNHGHSDVDIVLDVTAEHLKAKAVELVILQQQIAELERQLDQIGDQALNEIELLAKREHIVAQLEQKIQSRCDIDEDIRTTLQIHKENCELITQRRLDEDEILANLDFTPSLAVGNDPQNLSDDLSKLDHALQMDLDQHQATTTTRMATTGNMRHHDSLAKSPAHSLSDDFGIGL